MCLRVCPYYITGPLPPYPDIYVGDRFYELHLDAWQGLLLFQYRHYTGTEWAWEVLDSTPLSNPAQWHTIAVEAVSDAYTSFTCYLDGDYKFTATSSAYKDGLVGLWVQSDVALFDNVKVLDRR